MSTSVPNFVTAEAVATLFWTTRTAVYAMVNRTLHLVAILGHDTDVHKGGPL